MNTRRASAITMEGIHVNEEDPQDNQSLFNPPARRIKEFSFTLLMLCQAITTQARGMTIQSNREVGTHVNPNVNTTTSILRVFIRMNRLEFLGSKV